MRKRWLCSFFKWNKNEPTMNDCCKNMIYKFLCCKILIYGVFFSMTQKTCICHLERFCPPKPATQNVFFFCLCAPGCETREFWIMMKVFNLFFITSRPVPKFCRTDILLLFFSVRWHYSFVNVCKSNCLIEQSDSQMHRVFFYQLPCSCQTILTATRQ